VPQNVRGWPGILFSRWSIYPLGTYLTTPTRNPHYSPIIFLRGWNLENSTPLYQKSCQRIPIVILLIADPLWPPTIPEILTKIRPLDFVQTGVEHCECRNDGRSQACPTVTCGALLRTHCETYVRSACGPSYCDYHSAENCKYCRDALRRTTAVWHQTRRTSRIFAVLLRAKNDKSNVVYSGRSSKASPDKCQIASR